MALAGASDDVGEGIVRSGAMRPSGLGGRLQNRHLFRDRMYKIAHAFNVFCGNEKEGCSARCDYCAAFHHEGQEFAEQRHDTSVRVVFVRAITSQSQFISSVALNKQISAVP